MDHDQPGSSKGLIFNFKESEDNPILEFINNWMFPDPEPVETTLDPIAVAETMKPKINNNWSRKRKNKESKPRRRRLRQIRNFIVDNLIVDSFVVDVSAELSNQQLKDLLDKE